MYLEDLDLCARIGSAGLDLIYVPGAAVLHEAGHSATRSPRSDLLFQMEIGQAPWMYLRRYRGTRVADAYASALVLGDPSAGGPHPSAAARPIQRTPH